MGTAIVVGEKLARELAPAKRLLSTMPQDIEAEETIIVTSPPYTTLDCLSSPYTTLVHLTPP